MGPASTRPPSDACAPHRCPENRHAPPRRSVMGLPPAFHQVRDGASRYFCVLQRVPSSHAMGPEAWPVRPHGSRCCPLPGERGAALLASGAAHKGGFTHLRRDQTRIRREMGSLRARSKGGWVGGGVQPGLAGRAPCHTDHGARLSSAAPRRALWDAAQGGIQGEEAGSGGFTHRDRRVCEKGLAPAKNEGGGGIAKHLGIQEANSRGFSSRFERRVCPAAASGRDTASEFTRYFSFFVVPPLFKSSPLPPPPPPR